MGTYDNLLEAKAKKVGGINTGSGTGFGERDNSFDIPTEKVEAFKVECLKLKHVKRVEVIER